MLRSSNALLSAAGSWFSPVREDVGPQNFIAGLCDSSLGLLPERFIDSHTAAKIAELVDIFLGDILRGAPHLPWQPWFNQMIEKSLSRRFSQRLSTKTRTALHYFNIPRRPAREVRQRRATRARHQIYSRKYVRRSDVISAGDEYSLQIQCVCISREFGHH